MLTAMTKLSDLAFTYLIGLRDFLGDHGNPLPGKLADGTVERCRDRIEDHHIVVRFDQIVSEDSCRRLARRAMIDV